MNGSPSARNEEETELLQQWRKLETPVLRKRLAWIEETIAILTQRVQVLSTLIAERDKEASAGRETLTAG